MPLVQPLLIKKLFVKREFPYSSYSIKCCFSICDVNVLGLYDKCKSQVRYYDSSLFSA